MNIFDKILGALHINFLNRSNSPSIITGGNISAGGDIVVGNKYIKTDVNVPDIYFRMTRNYITQYPPDKSHFGELTTKIISSNNISEFEFLDKSLKPIGRCTDFQKLTHQSMELVGYYRIETKEDEKLFLNTLADNNGIIKARIMTTNGHEFIYLFKAVQGNWKKTIEGSPNLEDTFRLIKKISFTDRNLKR